MLLKTVFKSFNPESRFYREVNLWRVRASGGDCSFPREMVSPSVVCNSTWYAEKLVFLKVGPLFLACRPWLPKVNRGLFVSPPQCFFFAKEKKNHPLFFTPSSPQSPECYPVIQIIFPSLTWGFTLTTSSCWSCCCAALYIVFIVHSSLWPLNNYRHFVQIKWSTQSERHYSADTLSAFHTKNSNDTHSQTLFLIIRYAC